MSGSRWCEQRVPATRPVCQAPRTVSAPQTARVNRLDLPTFARHPTPSTNPQRTEPSNFYLNCVLAFHFFTHAHVQLFEQFDVLTRDGQISRDEVVATVKSMMNAKIGDPLDAEGEELLAQVSQDLRLKYGYDGGEGGGVLNEETARAAWAKYEPVTAKEEL